MIAWGTGCGSSTKIIGMNFVLLRSAYRANPVPKSQCFVLSSTMNPSVLVEIYSLNCTCKPTPGLYKSKEPTGHEKKCSFC